MDSQTEPEHRMCGPDWAWREIWHRACRVGRACAREYKWVAVVLTPQDWLQGPRLAAAWRLEELGGVGPGSTVSPHHMDEVG